MFKMALLTVLTITASAFATEVNLVEDGVYLSRVEKVVTLKDNGAGVTAVRLVQIDNGGSTDMSSFIAPSSLYLTVFKQREEYDTDAQYEVVSGLKSFNVEDSDLKAGTVLISVVQILEDGETEKTSYLKLSISAALKGTAEGKVKGTKVSVEDVTPRSKN